MTFQVGEDALDHESQRGERLLAAEFGGGAGAAPECVVATELLERVLEPSQVVIGDKDFAGAEFERHVRSAAACCAPTAKTNHAASAPSAASAN